MGPKGRGSGPNSGPLGSVGVKVGLCEGVGLRIDTGLSKAGTGLDTGGKTALSTKEGSQPRSSSPGNGNNTPNRHREEGLRHGGRLDRDIGKLAVDLVAPVALPSISVPIAINLGSKGGGEVDRSREEDVPSIQTKETEGLEGREMEAALTKGKGLVTVPIVFMAGAGGGRRGEERARFCVLAWKLWQNRCTKLMEGKEQRPMEV
ncbi:hypothetical protein Salat_1431300 [Sesamum alatum]|uniref:Uncharacterized protein n=1 Tax=Sesamum alatum TaxID=300844 RepID=A0AAE1YAD6_9LAMI|nr:hypothetical protein Salat_1431300 [Sesamum alatum]